MFSDSSEPAAAPRPWWQPSHEWGIIMGVVVAFVALFGPLFLLQPLAEAVLPSIPLSLNLKIAIVSSIITILSVLVVLLALFVYQKSWRDIGLGMPTFGLAGKAVVAFVVYVAATVVVQVIAQQFFALNTDEPQDLGYQSLSTLELVAAGISLIILTPFAEEIIFRGFMFAGFRRRLPFWVAAIGVSTLFGLVHGQWNVGLDVFVMSMVGCYLVEKTKSLWPAIFLHVIKNAVAFCLVYLYNG